MSTTTISDLANKTPSGSMYTVIEDSGSTGKTTINNLVSSADIIGSTSMGTTATTITGAIAEHEADLTELNGKFSSYLPADTNIDNWTTSGFWLYGRESPYSHTGTFPISDSYGTLICVKGTSANFAMQMIRSNSTSRTEGTLYIRYRTAGTWGSWMTYEDNSNAVNTVFASSDTSKYTLNDVRLVRRGSIYVLMGEIKCISPSTSSNIGIVSSGMPSVVSGQVFVPAWGSGNASKDAIGVSFGDQGVFLTYGSAGCYYELCIPMVD